MFERFDERARRVVVLAQEEARALRHNYIGTEHLLLAILRNDEDGGARHALEKLGIKHDAVREQVANIIGAGDEPTTGQIPFTPRAKKVLVLALREALRFGHNDIAPEHILLGVVHENEGVAVRILYDAGVTAQDVARTTLAEIGCPPEFADVYSTERPMRLTDRASFVIGGPNEWTSSVLADWAIPMVVGAALLGVGILIGWLIWA